MSAEFTQRREPSEPERRLLQALIARCNDCSRDWLSNLLVSPMEDGGMGSLKLHLQKGVEPTDTVSRRAAELQFTDADGVEVIVSLNLSDQGMPLEMDVWKTDFSPLVRVPERLDGGS